MGTVSKVGLPQQSLLHGYIQQGDFVVLTIEKDGSHITRTFKVSSDGLVYLPRDDALALGMNDGDLVDVSLLECIHAEPSQAVVKS